MWSLGFMARPLCPGGGPGGGGGKFCSLEGFFSAMTKWWGRRYAGWGVVDWDVGDASDALLEALDGTSRPGFQDRCEKVVSSHGD